MRRRRWLGLSVACLLGPSVLGAAAHTPYRQWNVFRSRHLQIGTSRQDLAGDEAGERWAAALRERLPDSRAMVTRAATLVDLCSLVKTDQIRLAVLSRADLLEVVQGRGPFASLHPMPLQVVFADERHVLVARESLPAHHGFLVASALTAALPGVGLPPALAMNLPVHPGAAALARGETVPMPAQ